MNERAHDELNGCWLMIDGEPYCKVLRMEISAPFQGRDQTKLILSKPVMADLLDPRKFAVRFDAENTVAFDMADGAEDGSWIRGCPAGKA